MGGSEGERGPLQVRLVRFLWPLFNWAVFHMSYTSAKSSDIGSMPEGHLGLAKRRLRSLRCSGCGDQSAYSCRKHTPSRRPSGLYWLCSPRVHSHTARASGCNLMILPSRTCCSS